MSLLALFRETVARYPQTTAVEEGDGTLSYDELHRRSDAVAVGLASRGVQLGDKVGLAFRDGIELVIAMLAVAKLGCAYVPLPPDYPEERLQRVVEAVELALVLGDGEGQVCLSSLAGPAAGQKFPDPGPETPLYLLFTSGTTGVPRGVVVTHDNLERLFREVDRRIDFRPGERWSQFHSYGFGYSVWEIWGALLHGGTLVMVPRALTRYLDEFLPWLENRRIGVLSLTPSAFRMLGQAAGVGEHRKLPDLRIVALSGEAVRPQQLRPWFAHFGDEAPEVWNSYALTETAGQITVRRMTRADLRFSGHSLIGAPLSDVSLELVDSELRRVPAGEAGEILLAGRLLSPGYHNDPEETARRFITWEGRRWFRTHDRARRLANGELEFLGRADRQVKVRGHRIELSEVESLLCSHPAVSDAVAFTRGEDEELTLHAAWVAHDGGRVEPEELRDYLASLLPNAAIPQSFTKLQELPLDPHGKVAPARIEVSEDPEVEPETSELSGALEELLAVLWSDLFEGRTVLPEHDFFELGGHSLLAMRLVATLRNDFNLQVSMRDLMESPKLRDLARAISSREESEPRGDSPHHDFMRQAIERARQALLEKQAPYAACVVHNGKIVAQAHNLVWKNNDPTAHAEVLALRLASARLSPEQLAESVVYSTCEPCSMCLSACHWCGIRSVVYAVTMEDEEHFGLSAPTVRADSLARQLGDSMEIVSEVCRGEMLDVLESWLKDWTESESYQLSRS